ncbi:hypothetical protein HF086_010813 [Spodoptera exigua]|uniref:Uncharacterized protein n=1 Tax=Spodoptera exigua TaxID=7107 RepID=A0A922SCC3_SPOEX|nr:hypothetical protein HF086_010813 [Spodoptera exigua]
MALADQEVKSDIAEGDQEVKSAKEKSDDESLEGKKTHTTAKVTRITKCTTSSPLPKLSDGFFPCKMNIMIIILWINQAQKRRQRLSGM